MDEAAREEADRRLEEALARTGAPDPRDIYRKALRELKRANPTGYDLAVKHFQDVLVPSIASREAEPLHAWREYGRLLGETAAAGRTVSIDATGRSHPYTPDSPLDRLVLHLPNARNTKAFLVFLPPKPSSAQSAALDLLVTGRHRLSG
jgi:hypothetical protein